MEINLVRNDEEQYEGIERGMEREAEMREEEIIEDVPENPPETAAFHDGHDSPFIKAARWLVYVTVFLLPLFFLPFTADVLEFNKQALLIAVVGIGLVLYLIDVVKVGVFKYKPTVLYWPVFGLVFAGIISVIFSVSRFNSLFGFNGARSLSLLSLIFLAVLFFLIVNVVGDKGKETLKKIIIVSWALAFIFGALQVLGLHLLRGSLFASPTFNSVGALNALGILAAVSLAFFTSLDSKKQIAAEIKEENSSKSVINWVVTGFRYIGFVSALFLVVLINWWPIWTVAFISLLAGVALESAGNPHLRAGSRIRMFVIPMTLIALGIFLMLVNFNWPSIKSKFPVEVALSQKTSWKIAFDSLKSRPLGFGLENFEIAYDKLKPLDIANTVFFQIRFNDSASEAANMAIEGGIPMVLVILSLFWFYGRELVGRFRKETVGGGEAGSIWAASLGLLAALFLYPFNLSLMAVLILLLALSGIPGSQDDTDDIAVAENVVTVNLEKSAKYSFMGSLVFIIGLVLVLVAGYFTVNNYMSNIYLAQALGAADRAKTIGHFVASANSNTGDTQILRLLSQAVMAQLADDLQAGPKKDESKENYNTRTQNEIASAINISLRATSVDPADSQNWANRGLVYQNLMTLVNGADQASVNMYKESLARNPADPLTYLRIGNVYLTAAENIRTAINKASPGQAGLAAAQSQMNDDMTKAEENFKKAISLYNNYGQALYNLAAVYDREGKLPEAIKQFEKLQTTNQRDPSILFQLGLLYYRNNQKDNAFNAWQQAVYLFPNYSNARWYLSLVYEERGNLAGALNQVEEIAKLNPDNDLVKQRLAQLEAGQRTIPPEKVLNKKPL